MAFRKGLKFALLFMFSVSTSLATVPTQTLELSPSLESSTALVNGSIITNLTDFTPLNEIPPDPLVVIPWQGTMSVSLELSNYVPEIWYTDALNAILAASRWAAIENFRGNGNRPIGRNLMYSSGSVTLTFDPVTGLKWSTWGLALSGLTYVFDHYEYTGFNFTVGQNYRIAGRGSLQGAAIATPLATPQATPQAA